MYGKVGPIEHIAEVGENVLLVEHSKYSLYQVAYIEPIPRSHPLVAEVTAGLGLVAGGAIPSFNTTALLDLNYGQLGQFRCQVLDDVHVVVRQAQALDRFALMNVTATINPFVHLEDRYDILTEFAIWEQRRVFLRVTNPRGYAVAQARVVFYGYKYVLAGAEGTSGGQQIAPLAPSPWGSIKEAVESGKKFAVVPVGGWEL